MSELHSKDGKMDRYLNTKLSEMTYLWIDHVYWARIFITDTVSLESPEGTKSPVLESTKQRLFRNQTDLGDNFGVFYGNDAGKKYALLLTSHIAQAANIVSLAIAGKDIASAYDKWKINAKQISSLLASKSKYIDEAKMKEHMDTHLRLTLDEVTAIISGKYDSSVTKFDLARNEAIMMSEYIASGVRRGLKIPHPLLKIRSKSEITKTKSHKDKSDKKD